MTSYPLCVLSSGETQAAATRVAGSRLSLTARMSALFPVGVTQTGRRQLHIQKHPSLLKRMGVATSIIVILIHHRLVEVHVLDIIHIVTERE